VLVIAPDLRAAIAAHGEAGYPAEICGFLIGRAAGEERRVEQVRPVRNAWEEEAGLRAALLVDRGEDAPSRADWEAASEERRFLIDPRDYAAADRDAQAAGLEIVGFYHSHPDHPAVPSRFDRDMAMPEQSYVIIAVRARRAAELRSWAIADFDAPFAEEELREG
jgi:proteasome lid subunit RPN8/RPN11